VSHDMPNLVLTVDLSAEQATFESREKGLTYYINLSNHVVPCVTGCGNDILPFDNINDRTRVRNYRGMQ
jgi:hypothetical protein